MKRREKNIEEFLLRHLGLFKTPPEDEMNLAESRIVNRLRSAPRTETRISESGSTVRFWRLKPVTVVLGAAAIVVLAVFLQKPRAIDAYAVVESADGTLFRVEGHRTQPLSLNERITPGETVRTSDSTARIALADESRVELRSRTEFSVERAEDGIRILLRKGGLIVNASKQRAGHLYVQTKDVTVSVVGTVFLVNAEEEGSRVAVIEGEVRVQQGTTTKNLMSGEQLSTNPKMEPLPVREEVSWSPNAETHVALLQQSTAPTAAVPKRMEFIAVSIRPNVPEPGGGYYFVPNGPNGPSWGFGCRGNDGISFAVFGTGPTILVPQGRCVGNGVGVMYLMTYAYGLPWRYGSGLPDWARHDSSIYGGELFQIEATADNPSTATTAQLREMLQVMLEDRFKMKVRRERQEVPGYSLRIARSGLKLKEASGDEEQPAMVLLDGRAGIKGKSSLDKLTRFMAEVVNALYIDTPFVDKTGVTGIYEYEFPLSLSRGGVRGANAPVGGPPPPQTRAERIESRASEMSSAMEDRLGLRLQRENISSEVIVIEQIERPSPN